MAKDYELFSRTDVHFASQQLVRGYMDLQLGLVVTTGGNSAKV